MSTSKRRAPAGVDLDLPVTVRFMPDERTEIVGLSKQDGRTMSSFVRMIFLLGLAEWKRQRGLK